jgi:hypothetical protein
MWTTIASSPHRIEALLAITVSRHRDIDRIAVGDIETSLANGHDAASHGWSVAQVALQSTDQLFRPVIVIAHFLVSLLARGARCHGHFVPTSAVGFRPCYIFVEGGLFRGPLYIEDIGATRPHAGIEQNQGLLRTRLHQKNATRLHAEIV